jgi:hypothetical protein
MNLYAASGASSRPEPYQASRSLRKEKLVFSSIPHEIKLWMVMFVIIPSFALLGSLYIYLLEKKEEKIRRKQRQRRLF